MTTSQVPVSAAPYAFARSHAPPVRAYRARVAVPLPGSCRDSASGARHAKFSKSKDRAAPEVGEGLCILAASVGQRVGTRGAEAVMGSGGCPWSVGHVGSGDAFAALNRAGGTSVRGRRGVWGGP